MKRLLLVPALALSLSGCAAIPALLGGLGAPSAPVVVADKTVLDEKAALAAESFYTGAARAGALAFRTKIIQPSSNPAVQNDNFCDLVRAKLFTPTDRGSQVMALECQLRAARDAVRTAYDAGNAANYEQAFANAKSLYDQIMVMLVN